jgi:predicted dithiol-disulfide oxidoreductase (DUF899 family)
MAWMTGTDVVTYSRERPGMSAFVLEEDVVYHTYSCYLRGVDMLNGAYHFLGLVPKGRDEDGFSFPTEWVRRHDQY